MAYALKPGDESLACRRWRGRRQFRASLWAGAVALFCVGAFVSVTPGAAEEKPNDKLLFLVARSPITDPFFKQSVVLMLPLEDKRTVVGLVVNKPTPLSLPEIFPDSPALKNRPDKAYLGGPVDMETPSLIFHAAKPPKQSLLLYDDVYLTLDGPYIMKRLRDPKQTGDFRLFLGRAQWDPEQLQVEALRGSWYSLRAEGDVIFDHDSERLWKRLHALARPPSDVKYRLPPTPRGSPYTE